MAVKSENEEWHMNVHTPPSHSFLLKPKGVLKLNYVSIVFLQDNIIFSDALPYLFSHMSPLRGAFKF